MQAFCKFLEITAPKEFVLEPVNLIHLKVLLLLNLLAASLEAEERE
jgi:hypothetical protein